MSADRSERIRRPDPIDDRRSRQPAPAAPRFGPAAVLALQRSAGNQAVQRMLLRQTPEAGPAAAVDPWPAIKAIDAWRARADAALDATTAWETANWIAYLGRTSSDPVLSLADSELAGVMSNTIGNVLTEVGKSQIEAGSKLTASALGALIGTAAEPVGGTAIGFVVGVVIESVASYMFETVTGKRDAGETATEAEERVTQVILKQHTLLTVQHALAAAELETLVATAHDRAEQAQSQAEIDALVRWTAAEDAKTKTAPAVGPPYPLASELLRVWALEHAGDLSSARPGTDSTQHESAVAETLNGLEAQPSLFVYQTRAEWERAGLDHRTSSEALMSDADALIAQVGTPLTGTTAVPAVVGAADAVQAAHQGQEFEFTRFRDPDAVRWYIVGHDSGDFDKDWLLEKLEQGKVRLYCTLDIVSASDSAYIGEWRWRAEIELEAGENPNPGPGGVGSGPVMDSGQPADTLHLAFEVGPTSG